MLAVTIEKFTKQVHTEETTHMLLVVDEADTKHCFSSYGGSPTCFVFTGEVFDQSVYGCLILVVPAPHAVRGTCLPVSKEVFLCAKKPLWFNATQE